MEIITMQDFTESLTNLLAGQPEGAKGVLITGELVWIEEGCVIGAWPEDGEENAFQFDESAMEPWFVELLNAWIDRPVFTAPDIEISSDEEYAAIKARADALICSGSRSDALIGTFLTRDLNPAEQAEQHAITCQSLALCKAMQRYNKPAMARAMHQAAGDLYDY